MNDLLGGRFERFGIDLGCLVNREVLLLDWCGSDLSWRGPLNRPPQSARDPRHRFDRESLFDKRDMGSLCVVREMARCFKALTRIRRA